MLIDEEFWKRFANANTKVALVGYTQANRDIVEAIEELIAKTSNYNELKNELTQFCNERKEFVKFAFDNLPQS